MSVAGLTADNVEQFGGEDGTHRCICCSACERACPNGTIRIEPKMVTTATGAKKKKLAKYFYDLGSCTFCENSLLEIVVESNSLCGTVCNAQLAKSTATQVVEILGKFLFLGTGSGGPPTITRRNSSSSLGSNIINCVSKA